MWEEGLWDRLYGNCTTNDGVLGDYASIAPLIVHYDLSLKRVHVIIDIWGPED